MKTISVTTFRRPQYLRQVFEKLNVCTGIKNYTLFIQCEPNPDVKHLVENFNFIPKTNIRFNSRLFGCKSNNLSVLEWAFEYTDYNIHVEDDILLAKDALTYFEYCNKYKEDKEVFTITGYNRDVTKQHYQVVKEKWFVPWGWATWKDRFEEIKGIKKIHDEYTWDDQINRNIRKDRYLVKPLLARCQNIGAYGGSHIPSPQWHINNQYNSFWRDAITVGEGNFYE